MTYTLLRLLLILALGLSFVGLGLKGSQRGKGVAGALAGVGLACVLLHYAAPRFHLDRWLPLPPALWRDVLFAPGALLVGVALDRARGSGRERVLTALLTLGYAVFLLHDPAYVLFKAGENQAPPRIKDGVVLQRNGLNCVPSSAATILRLWGLSEASDGRLALRAQTSYYGTPDHRIVDAIRAVGAEAGIDALRLETTWDELRAIDHPVILHVELVNALPHAIALLGLGPDEVWVGEPLVGLQHFASGGLAFFEQWKKWDRSVIVIGRDFRYDLGLGDRSPKVAALRGVLGAGEGEVFDEALSARVRAFQQERKLPQTGRLDPKTILALHAIRDRGRIPSIRRAATPRKQGAAAK